MPDHLYRELRQSEAIEFVWQDLDSPRRSFPRHVAQSNTTISKGRVYRHDDLRSIINLPSNETTRCYAENAI